MGFSIKKFKKLPEKRVAQLENIFAFLTKFQMPCSLGKDDQIQGFGLLQGRFHKSHGAPNVTDIDPLADILERWIYLARKSEVMTRFTTGEPPSCVIVSVTSSLGLDPLLR